MDQQLGALTVGVQQPVTPKFRFPLLILPELFTTTTHLALLAGYAVSLGWEVYAAELFLGAPPRESLTGLYERVSAARMALGREVVALGHGVGGLLALKLAEQSGVRAGVALAPMIPGVQPRIAGGMRNRIGWRGKLHPPAGRRLFELIADADPFTRDSIIRQLRPCSSTLVKGVIGDELRLEAGAPRLIVSGDSDIFAPRAAVAKLASQGGAELAFLAGRGHWLIGGRALERAVAEFQRFIVKALGAELLLLYADKE